MKSESLREIFINNLRFYRAQKHFSQEKLSYAIDKSMNYINQIENKNTWPQPEVIEQICQVLEISPTILFDKNSSPENVCTFSKDEFISRITNEIHDLIKIDVQKSIEKVLDR